MIQTGNMPYYGQLLWNPIHLFGGLFTYPLLIAYLLDLMRPGSIGRRYLFYSFVPPVTLALLHILFRLLRAPLPVFTDYATIRACLGEPELWTRMTAVILFVIQTVVYITLSTRMLREHIRTLKSNFSSTAGYTLKWIWWNIGISLCKRVSVLLMLADANPVFRYTSFLLLGFEPVITTIWALRQKDLYGGTPVRTEADKKTPLFEKENIPFELSSEKRKILKQNLLKLLEEDEIFKDPDLNIEKLRTLLYTNRTYLSQIINQDMDTSFYNLINTCRLHKAVKMMQDPAYHQIPLTNIAEICGFKSLNAFSQFFKQTYGQPPTEWRKEM